MECQPNWFSLLFDDELHTFRYVSAWYLLTDRYWGLTSSSPAIHSLLDAILNHCACDCRHPTCTLEDLARSCCRSYTSPDIKWPIDASSHSISTADMFSCQGPRSPQRVSSQKSEKVIVAFQYGLLVVSAADSAGAMYLLLGPGNEVTIAGASPVLTAVSTISNFNKLLHAEILRTRRPCRYRIYYSIRSCLGDTTKAARFRFTSREMFCVLRA